MTSAGDSRRPVRPIGSNARQPTGPARRPPTRPGGGRVHDGPTGPDPEPGPGSGPPVDTPPHGQPPVRRRPRGGSIRSGQPTGATVPRDGSDVVADDEGADDEGVPANGHPGDASVEDAEAEGGSAAGARPSRLGRLGPVSPYRIRRRHRFSRRIRLLFTATAVVVLALIGAAAAWYETSASPSGGPGRRVLVHVAKGESMGALTATLARKDIVSSGLAFRISLFIHGTPTVRPGGYSLRTNQSFGAVRSELAAGPNVVTLTVPAGFTITEIARVLLTGPGNLGTDFVREAKSGAVSSPFQSAPGTSLEGLLGTGSYELVPGETAQQLLTKMVDRFDRQAAAAGLTPSAAAALGYTPYQLVTVASIAQKEGYFHRYMGRVARVIYNRLHDGMPLAMTATVLYALHQDGGPVTSADQHLTSPYNTYLHAGLTPTPICSPSPTALEAAAAPPPGGWLYFELVTPKKGVMVFSTTYTQQLQAEQQARANAAKAKK